ncbi:MAG TPA: 2-oxo acid dehydrogenase subunit E2 [Myxococcales bacterium]|nr:2-oxo acid dehydrogenase subunit E2 [Myxococcales bacterium]
MPNLELTRKDDVSSFRKIAIGTWATAYDPSVYGTMDVNMDEAMKYLADFRARTGRKLTISHMMAKVAAMALKEVPDANAIMRWNRIYLRKRIGIFFQVVMTDEGHGKTDLSGATIYDVEQKSLLEIYDDFNAKVEKVRQRKDPALEQTRKTFLGVPYFMLNFLLKAISFLMYTLNLDMRWAGMPQDPFGSMMITNVGSLGLDTAFVPLVPYSRVPILLALGNVREAPVVRDGKLGVGKIMKVNATFDHRFIDGFHASVLSRVVRDWFEHPYERFDNLDAIKPAAASSTAAAIG